MNVERLLLNGGQINAETRAPSGIGGNLTLQVSDLMLLREQSIVRADASNNSNGGNIRIQTPNGYLIAGVNQNNDIVATADQGRGGNITVNTRGLLGLEEGLSRPANLTNDIDASSEQGPQGIVNITQPDINPTQGLLELPTDIVDASSLIAETCPTGDRVANVEQLSEFVITGRGGLPPGPADPRDEDAILTDWATLETEPEPTASVVERPGVEHSGTAAAQPNREPLVEAQGWEIDSNGKVVLLAQAPSARPEPATIQSRACDWKEATR